MADVPLTLSNAAGGVVEAYFQEALQTVRDAFDDPERTGGVASITLKLTVEKMGDDSAIIVLKATSPSVKLPAKKTQGRIVRFSAGVPVVDEDETDDTGQHRIPFPRPAQD